jgi:hypothetical protein
MCQLAEQHGDELRPAAKAFGPSFRVMFLDQGSELRPGKMLEQLIEQTGCLYDGNALLFGNSVQDSARSERTDSALDQLSEGFFLDYFSGLNARAVLDKSVLR